MFADRMDLHDVGVLQPCHRLGLRVEALSELRPNRLRALDELEGDEAVEALLPCPVHHPHAAATDFLQDFVARNGRQTRDASSDRSSA